MIIINIKIIFKSTQPSLLASRPFTGTYSLTTAATVRCCWIHHHDLLVIIQAVEARAAHSAAVPEVLLPRRRRHEQIQVVDEGLGRGSYAGRVVPTHGHSGTCTPHDNTTAHEHKQTSWSKHSQYQDINVTDWLTGPN